jgi:hypothetical protein
MREVAPDLVKEISLGSVVCDALEMVYGADSVDYERDLQTLRDSLQRYITYIDTHAGELLERFRDEDR